MSEETQEWLANNCLVGFTEKRGNAWHYREGDANHYPGAIPVDDVIRRLFDWKAIEASVKVRYSLDGTEVNFTDQSRVAIVRPDTKDLLGVFRKGYKMHQYKDWLLDNVAALLDDELSIGGAGLLRKGGVAYVQVETPETITTKSGIDVRPFILAGTAHDGTLSSTYGMCYQIVVCDNTFQAGMVESANAGMRYRVKHTANSSFKIEDAHEGLKIMHEQTGSIEAELEAMTATKVTDKQFMAFLDELVPVPDKPGVAQRNAEDKRAVFGTLWNEDERVAPWKNTAFGVVQAVNTANHHMFDVRGERAERNTSNMVYGLFAKEDRKALAMLDAVLA